MTERIHKVNSLLEHEVSAIVARDFKFPDALVTITHVDTTPNLIEARAHVSVMPESQIKHIVGVLNKGVYEVQKKINKKLNMRPIPRISFVEDDKVHDAARIEELLSKLKNDEK